ncbi:MAG: hypothetical protein WBQ95_22485, partial [Terracidiphilus sp.]
MSDAACSANDAHFDREDDENRRFAGIPSGFNATNSTPECDTAEALAHPPFTILWNTFGSSLIQTHNDRNFKRESRRFTRQTRQNRRTYG